MEVRPLGIDDVELICRHREAMFREGGRDEDVLQAMTQQFRPWLASRLRDGSYFGYVLVDQGQPVGGIGLTSIDWPQHPSHPTQDKRGYVLNAYVETTHRKQGLGRKLMQLAEDEFARREIQFSVLHATEMGRSLYVALGWHATSEMSRAVRA
jgi:ribosomal protein S18 acetylase RimI-like enzyme